jgi:hypothetical protein
LLVTVEMLVWLYASIVGRIAEIATRRTDVACFFGIRTKWPARVVGGEVKFLPDATTGSGSALCL